MKPKHLILVCCLKSVIDLNEDRMKTENWHDQVLQIKSKLDNTCVCIHVRRIWRADDLLLLYSNRRQSTSWSCSWPELHYLFFAIALKKRFRVLRFFYDISFSLTTWLMLLLIHCLHLLQNTYISCCVERNQRCRYATSLKS